MTDHNTAFGEIGTRRAYRNGDRCDDCKRANADYQAAIRARNQPANNTTAEPWPDNAETESIPVPSGYPCKETGCDLETYWVGGNTALECEAGHWQTSPKASGRANARLGMLERAIVRDAEPTMQTTNEIIAGTDFLANKYRYVLGLRTLASRCNPDNIASGWRETAFSFCADIQAMITQTESTRSQAELSNIQNAYSMKIARLEIDIRNLDQQRVIQGSVMPDDPAAIDYSPRMITTGHIDTDSYGGNESDTLSADYADSVEDWDDTERYSFSPDPAGLKGLFYAGVIVAGFIGAFILWEKYLDQKIPVKCQGPHRFRPACTTRRIGGWDNDPHAESVNVYICGSNKCKAWAYGQFMNDNPNRYTKVYGLDSDYMQTRREAREAKHASETDGEYPDSGNSFSGNSWSY